MADNILSVLSSLTYILIFLLGLGLALLVILFIIDVTQKQDAVRRNYPVIGRFRHLFSSLGEFFRQYFFAMDREEMPFNRAEREWVVRAAKGKGNTIAFGSTKNLQPAGTPIFVNCPFPTLEKDAAETALCTIGPYCEKPFESRSLFNISAMSFGALSVPAIRALSNGGAHGRMLAEYRRGRAVRISSGRRLRHRFPDRHCQIWRAQRGWESEQGQAESHRRT